MELNPLRHLVNGLLACSLLLLSACGGGSSTTGPTTGGSGNPPPPPAPEILFGGGGATVMSLSVDVTTGVVTPISSVPRAGGNGVFGGITSTPSGKFVYASDNSPFGIDAYSTSSNGSLSALSGSPFPLPEPLPFLIGPVVMHPSGNFLYVVAPDSGGASAYTINATTGALTVMAGSPFSFPPVDNPGQMEAGVMSKSGKFLYLADFYDAAWGYSVNQSTGALTPIPGVPFSTGTVNAQPQTIQIDPSGKFVYVGLTNIYKFAGFTADPTTGALTPMPGSPFDFTGEIAGGGYVWTAIDPAGHFLYVYNGLNYSIAAFSIDSTTGVPTPIAGSPFFIPSTPLNPPSTFSARDHGPQGPLLVDPSGKYLLIACGSQVIEGFSINSNTGALTWLPGAPFTIPNPALGLFMPVPH